MRSAALFLALLLPTIALAQSPDGPPPQPTLPIKTMILDSRGVAHEGWDAKAVYSEVLAAEGSYRTAQAAPTPIPARAQSAGCAPAAILAVPRLQYRARRGFFGLRPRARGRSGC